MKQTAAVYDRWLHVLGGGERHTIAIATELATHGYEVTILTHRPTDLTALKKKFGLQSLPFTIRYLPELWDYELSPYTKEYDLFVLSSFADIFPSKAKKSILSVFFPVSQKLTMQEWCTRVLVVPLVRKLFQFPLYIQLDPAQITIGCNKATKRLKIRLFFPALALSTIEQLKVTSLDTTITTEKKVLHHTNEVVLTIESPKPVRQWQIYVPESEYCQGVKASLVTSWWDSIGQLLMTLVPKWKERFVAGPRKFSLHELESYNAIIANSKYTKKWIARYWGINTKVVYPPVPIKDFFVSDRKRNWIVSTGRFFLGGHNKKQLEMVEAFKKLHAELPNWELHLVGSINDGDIHQAYYKKVVAAAAGFPIVFHTNVDFRELATVLSQGRIYWHATGLGIDEYKYPVMLEHFGLTIIEAMAAGCIPVVINKGGPAEIARDVGYTWNTTEELIHITKHLAKDPTRLKQFKEKALEASNNYGKEQFSKAFSQVLESV